MALRAIGNTYPNPPVGAIIVKDDIILSRGWTQPHGTTHAEMHAIHQINDKKLIEGSTLYCTLEPCYHQGKNPPCVNNIIKFKFKKIVISHLDKNPKVYSKSVKKLKSAGIIVVIKSFGKEIKRLNTIFFNTINHNKPYVTLKIASTADGKIATDLNESKWITNANSRIRGHMLRSLNDCMLVGTGTIKKDNPLLDCRIAGLSKRSPDLFILDRNLKLQQNHKIFFNKNRNVYIFHSKEISSKNTKIRHVKYIKLGEINNVLNLKEGLQKIANLGYMNVLVEGGSKLTASLLKANLIDEIYWFRASKIMGDNGLGAISSIGVSSINRMKKFKFVSYMQNGNDGLTIYRKS